MKNVMKKRTVMALILTFCLALSGMFVPFRTALAAEGTNEKVLEDRKGVLQVAMYIKADDKDLGFMTIGTGFLVGDAEGAQHVITNHHVAHAYTPEQMKEYLIASETPGVTADSKIALDLRIIVKRDVLVKATIVNESEAADFAILKMEQPIYDRTPLILADSSQVATTQEVYALGFPGIVQDIQNDRIYTADDVTVTSGTVAKTTDVQLSTSPIACITHTAQITFGNSGGPLVDREGRVIGINTTMSNENGNNDYFYSTQINEVKEVLDALGIPYTSDEAAVQMPDTTAPESEAPESESMMTESDTAAESEDNSALLAELEMAVKDAKEVVLDDMTEDSSANFKAAISAAEATLNNDSADEEEISDAIRELDTAKKGLVEASGMNVTMMIIIAAAAIVLIIIIVLVIVFVSKSKKKKAQAEEAQRAARMQQQRRMQPQQPQNGWNAQHGAPVPPRQNQNPQPRPVYAQNDGAGETSVLSDGSNETTVLGGQNIPRAALIRSKNGESITVTKAIFKIGKERRKVDYCISDNTNVSRTHADIIFRDGSFYIIDNGTTNGTTVNGVSIAGGQPRKIENNDIIVMADEKFQFKLM